MESKEKIIFILFFIIILVLVYTLIQIYNFMPIFHSCNDDFAVVDKCNCVPCSWKDALTYNGETGCEDYGK
jgi:hypothetical protein